MNRRLSGFAAVAGLAALLCAPIPAAAQALGAASSFAVAGAAGVTAAGPAGTVINGDVGSSPSASITGFPPGVVVPPFGIHANDAAAIAAQAAAVALFTSLSAGVCTDAPLPQMAAASIGPGIHCFAAAADLSAGGTLTLSGAGLYIFRVPTALTANVGSTVLLNGVDPCNVFWQVGSAATLNGASFTGNVVAQAGVTLGVGASLTGRALATVGPVTLSGTNTVGGCSSAVAPPPVCPSISIAPLTSPSGLLGVAYSQQITASGGTAPYTFSVTSGTLPAGITLTAAGVMAGTPTATGASTFTVRATDASGCFSSISYTLTIAAAVPTLAGWAMFILIGLLGLAGVAAMRRRVA